MFREFPQACAWTDAMCENGRCSGLIEYQVSREGAPVEVLWVYAPLSTNAAQAEAVAQRMLERVCDIDAEGRVHFDDGVILQEDCPWPV
ncbi:hypothetical protein ACQCLI_11210 [Pseudomonas nitroreducens]|uniref:Uncharacterized protein n=1 Tax=Pseudomonas nitroreducens TaxID=46680 RepID=A0A246F8C0_PSENT|nr:MULTISPECIES: hypothetical protein [Pseudomonas]MCG8906956.1 hypothetical protein [Pseudomonas sp. DP-17]OWP49874.1 hypothetical protein CEG18_15660 [Pseudomonas nitroreducens]